ncbi:MAG: L-fuculose-phosphate aldolase [Chloroflexota bacterium]|nr:L-fuculose-phosphate aldolase [Chloroflexota bacterium]
MKFETYRQQVFDTTQKLVKHGLIRISSGNISVRINDELVAITPSSIPYDELKVEDIVVLDMLGQTVDGTLRPSVEKMLHIHCYQARPDVHAVIHTHAISAITLSLSRAEIPPLSIEMVSLGAPIPTLAYSLPGSLVFADRVAGYFQADPHKKAVLLENHGAVVVGSDLKEAFQNASNLETGAQIYYRALVLGRPMRVLTPDDLDQIHASYSPAS